MCHIDNCLEFSGALQNSDNNKFHPTVGGLLMFGKYEEILSHFPFYSLNYYDNNVFAKKGNGLLLLLQKIQIRLKQH